MPSLILFLIAVTATALFGASFTPGAWYETIAKPPWTPPNWLFGPVWTLLYAGIAVAGWRVWRSADPRSRTLLALWIAQLLLNGAWSWLFFGLNLPGLALLDILLLLTVIVLFATRSRGVEPVAFWLFVPYGVWVAYAASLNLYIWQANP